MTLATTLGFAFATLLLFDGLTSPQNSGGRARRASRRAGALWQALAAGLVAAGAILASTGRPFLSAVAAAGGAWSVRAVRDAAERKRRARARAAWPDAIAELVASTRAGMSLSEALAGLADRPGALVHGFSAFRAAHRSAGNFAVALGALKDALADPVADRVCTALQIAHEVGGGDLVRVLEALASQVRDENHIRSEVEARWSWTIAAARLAATAPWLVLLLTLTKPEGWRAFASPAGSNVLLLGGIATIVGYRWMLWIARLPEESRP